MTLVPLPAKGAKSLSWAEHLNKFSAQESDLTPFVGNETKVKIPSEIKPPLDAITAWPHNGHLLFYLFHASALYITTYCVGVPQFDAIFWNRALEREMNSFLFFKSRKKDARLSSNVYWSFNIWCAIMCPRNFSSPPVYSVTKPVRSFLFYPFIQAYPCIRNLRVLISVWILWTVFWIFVT